MPSYSRNRLHRPAAWCSRLTGALYTRCLAWEQQGLISRHNPVPDAGTPAQRNFEALIFNKLANELRDRQLDRAIVGVVAVIPARDEITLCLHEVMAERVWWSLLPRYNTESEEILGVPGLRIHEDGGCGVVLRDLWSHARVRVGQSPRCLPELHSQEHALWASEKRLHEEEAWRRTFEDDHPIAGCDWLLSRLLRRPLLLSKAASGYGWANSYTPAGGVLTVESCCTEQPAALAEKFRKSGLTRLPDDMQVGAAHSSLPSLPERFGTLDVGEARVTLRTGLCSARSPEAMKRIRLFQEQWHRFEGDW